MPKKHAARQRSQKRRRRTEKRRRRAAQKRKPSETNGQRVLMTTWFGDPHPDDDNCPWCRAQRELGIRDGEPITDKQGRAYQRRVKEIIAEEGMPPGAVDLTSEASQRRAAWIDARLRERGELAELETLMAMTDAELAEHMRSVSELGDAYDRLN